ncbi:MAG: FeoB-associated Cys-rich membrane protein [Phycisphaeraceae bacterium]
MPAFLTAYLPHLIGLAAMGYLIARWLRSWRRKRLGQGPACGGGCASCGVNGSVCLSAGKHAPDPRGRTATSSDAGGVSANQAFVPLRTDRRG